jgi:hypothetical protein
VAARFLQVPLTLDSQKQVLVASLSEEHLTAPNEYFLGIRTSPPGGGQHVPGQNAATVYLPFSYMFGGITVFAPADSLKEIDMPVETCLKLCATAFVTNKPDEKVQPPSESEASDME